LHNCLAAMDSTLIHKANLALFVHVLSESTDKGFVRFQFGVGSDPFS
jgi:CelD/BcsL family acetyltransferase involved in cellulose biosynthesis